jgi:hypothetical protein
MSKINKDVVGVMVMLLAVLFILPSLIARFQSVDGKNTFTKIKNEASVNGYCLDRVEAATKLDCKSSHTFFNYISINEKIYNFIWEDKNEVKAVESVIEKQPDVMSILVGGKDE